MKRCKRKTPLVEESVRASKIKEYQPHTENLDNVADFLAFLADDIQRYPNRLVPITASMVNTISDLTRGVEIDLDEPLPDEYE